MILRCTKKLLAVLGTDHAAAPGPASDAEEWYANLLWLTDASACCSATPPPGYRSSRSTCAQLTFAQPTVWSPAPVERELRRKGLQPATFGNLRSQELILAQTADRSVLGCMNDMAILCEVAISDTGGLQRSTSAR